MNILDRLLWFLICVIALLYENVVAFKQWCKTRIIIVSPTHDIAVLHKEPPIAYCIECSNDYGEPFVFDDYCALCGHTKVRNES